MLAIGVLAAWGAGIITFIRGELSRSPGERLAEVAMRVAPGATYFAVEREGQHVGFASNTLDTIPGGLQVTDYFVADLAVGGVVRRASAQSIVHLSRALALRDFTMTFGTDSLPVTASGRTVGDSLLEYVVQLSGGASDTTRVRLIGPLLLPTLVPLAVALGRDPKVGVTYSVDIFDPTTMSTKLLGVTIAAESLFVVADSAAFDPTSKRWLRAHADSVRGWRVVSTDGESFDTWVDELGRLIAVRAPAGFVLHRTAYELAFENWRSRSAAARRLASGTSKADDHRETGARTAISAGVTLEASQLDTMRIRLRGIDLSRLQLQGGYQSLAGDTVTMVRDNALTLRPSFPLPPSDVVRRRFSRELRAEPLLEVDHPSIVALAKRLKGADAQADVVIRRIAAWVHDSVAKETSITIPSAITTLRSRQGDCIEHTQLFVALARAAGVPTRAVSGMIYLDGRFYYHAWAEVLLQRWVPVDPTLGQVPADASHVRMIVGGLSMQSELARVITRADVDVVQPSRSSASVHSPLAQTVRR